MFAAGLSSVGAASLGIASGSVQPVLSQFIHLAEVGSTNDWLKAHAAGLPDGQWVYADHQTGGRGRRGRPWQMTKGNLAASCLLRLDQLGGSAGELGFVVALALFDSCQQLVGPGRLALKWPNDLLLDGVKLSGILLELEGAHLVLGVGVNLAHAPQLPDRPVASLADVGVEIVPGNFLELLAARFQQWRKNWQAQGFAHVRQSWLARAHPKGTRLVVRNGGGDMVGYFHDLGPDGALHLAVGGEIRVVHAGDVWSEEGQG